MGAQGVDIVGGGPQDLIACAGAGEVALRAPGVNIEYIATLSAEEKDFFPSIEKISGVKGLMERNIEQHRAFTPGFDLFQEYSRTCLPKNFDGRKVRSLVDDFAQPLTQHLHDEIDTLRALDKYDSERIRQAYRQLEKSLMATDNVSCILLNPRLRQCH